MVLPCIMSALNSIGGGCFGWIGEHLKTEAGHLIAYGDNLDNLRAYVQDLSDAIDSVERRIEEAQNNRGATRVEAGVSRLLERMTSVKEEASKIITDEERGSDCTCIIRLRPNLWACYVTSKSVKKKIDQAALLLEKQKKLDGEVSTVDYSKSFGVKLIPDFEEFESRQLVSNQIIAALKEPSVNIVGVYGMGGTGKTTLAEQIGASLHLDKTFSYVVLVTVSEKQNQFENNYEPSLFNIQKQIAERFKIQLERQTIRERAAELYEQLVKKDKVLIILDDIWSKFDLNHVGIPHKKIKILMTSRSEMVLRKDMDSTTNFRLDSLPFPDAWILFDRMVGGDDIYYNWRPTAEQVIIKCEGIPILLVTIARALRNEDSVIWKDALTQLKQFDGVDIVKEPYRMIEVSYNFLKNEEIKKLFLLCAQLNHRSIPMKDLLKYAMGLDLFSGCKKVEEVSGRLHKYLCDLIGCCLLQEGNEEEIIKMHDVVHKFASLVAFRDHHMFSVASDGELEEWPSEEQFEKFTAVSLPYCHLPSSDILPATFDNPNLESFLMLRSQIDASFKIPNNFFAGMKGLKLMSLTRVSLSPALVSSLGALVKLQTLCLDNCRLTDMTIIGELRMLQALSLVEYYLVSIPKEMGKLGSTLKLLDLSGCEQLETIAAGVISKLILLEDMRIGDSPIRWQRLEGNESADYLYEAKVANLEGNDNVDDLYESKLASLEEFKNLQNLNNLEICIPDHAKMFPKDLVFEKLESFKIFFGNARWLSNHYEFTRSIHIFGSSAVEFESDGTKALIARADSLCLSEIMSSVSVSELDQKGFSKLKYLKVARGDGIEYIVKKNYKNCIFPKLETLEVFTLGKLEKICDDYDHPLLDGSFENLRLLSVLECKLLNDLFSSNLAIGLLRLKEINVDNCESMESIIACRESDDEKEIKIGFTHELRILKLINLPRLISFFNFERLEGLPPSPTPFFNKQIVLPKLEDLTLWSMNIEKIWDDHLAITTEGFQNLTNLTVYDCHNLSYMFTFSMIKALPQLKHLDMVSCGSIQEIVTMSKEEMQGERLLLFPKLEILQLCDLDSLTSFCSASDCNFQFPSLSWVSVSSCFKMKFFSNGALSTPKVLRMWISWALPIENMHDENDTRWNGDLDSTIRQLYEDREMGVAVEPDSLADIFSFLD